MAEVKTPSKEQKSPADKAPQRSISGKGQPQKRGPSLHEIYALPAPIRTFPLPTFIPNNPVSIFQIAYVWLGQVFRPPPAEPAVVYHGSWSPATGSVHIVDEKSMRGLWEQGFYGKGSLSRSEPNWLKREQVRRGLEEAHVSEIMTAQRREERIKAKWERARLEQEAIQQTRLEEARRNASRKQTTNIPQPTFTPVFTAPVGPLELLALPNSDNELAAAHICSQVSLNRLELPPAVLSNGHGDPGSGNATDVGSHLHQPSLSDLLPSDAGPDMPETSGAIHAGSLEDEAVSKPGESVTSVAMSPGSSSESSNTKTVKRQKSVRFSPRVESTTFQLTDPPSPNHSATNGKAHTNGKANGITKGQNGHVAGARSNGESSTKDTPSSSTNTIANKEHLQLTPEEALFLSFGLGALKVTDSESSEILSNRQLLTRFRQYSYFPPRIGPDDGELGPDDPFLVHYAVYHHFRSLGWVPRAGIKFGVDWLLYYKGPVFDHAEYGLIVIPSYTDPWWKASGKTPPQKTWAWLHSIVRVLAHVMKSLVLVYVDIPPPPKFDAEMEKGFSGALQLYNIREIMVKRWSSNRNR